MIFPRAYDKTTLLAYFRNEAENFFNEITSKSFEKKDAASKMNTFLSEQKQSVINWLPKTFSGASKLETVLLVTYCSNLVMLEYRNKLWKYDYMAFSRRIGEIWEPFCKLAFQYPINNVKVIEPLDFKKVQNDLIKLVYEYVAALAIEDFKKKVLTDYYDKTWSFIDSGSINLSLDLHFEFENKKYNVDFKSGFNSNEKGNTNRLLLVGSIYSSISDVYTNVILVRSPEEENNHYLQTLKKSPYWKVYCADAAYEEIHRVTGFDIKTWMHNNLDWKNDISKDFKDYLIENELLQYLTW